MINKFSKKLLAAFLAAIMALTSFTGAFSAFAATADKDYHDENIEALHNALGWVELQNEQTCAALLDYADDMLAKVDYNLFFSYGINLGAANIVFKVDGKIDSISGILETVAQLQTMLSNYGGIIGGDVKNVDLSAINKLSYNSNTNESKCGRAYRERNTAKSIIMTILELLYANTKAGNSVIKQVLTGKLDLGLLSGAVNLWSILENLLGDMPADYQNNLVFNIVTKLITANTDWYTAEEAQKIFNQESGYELDRVLFKALSESLLKQINVQVTYPDGTNSRDLYAQGIKEPNLLYTSDGNVYIFQYDEDGDGQDDADLQLTTDESLFQFAFEAFQIAWKTCLAPTLGTLNSSVKDYDSSFRKWAINTDVEWDYDNVANNYTEENVQAWAESMSYDLDEVKADLSYNREIVENPQYNWRDIDSTRLFNELRYSPLMEYYFKEPTGPMNTIFKCTGTPNIDKFMADIDGKYTSMLGGLNDFLVAAVKDFMPKMPADKLVTIGDTTDASTIASTLVNNAATVFQYAADAADKNILSGFYKNNGESATLNESNFEEAMVPLLIACLENNIGSLDNIHKDKWDACKDAEGVAVVILEEYLSYILPDRDYSSLITKDDQGFYNVTLEGTLLSMARDAVGYVMMQYVPVEDAKGQAWSIYDVDVQTYDEQKSSGSTLFDLLNSVVVYYANDRGVGSLLGLVDASGNCTITSDNNIWQNFDVVINKLLPVLGELQYGDSAKKGQFNSEDLLYNDLIKGALNIGDTSHASGFGGISNFIYRLATIINAPSIKTKGIDLVVYDFLKDLLNGIFGARYTPQQTYVQPIPDAEGDAVNYPFHAFIQTPVIAGDPENSNDIGVIGEAIINVIEFAGYNSYPDTVWDGLMFAVQAVNSFVPGFVPQISDYTVGKAEATLDKVAVTGYNYGALNTNISVENLGTGINRNTLDINGNVSQLSRSYIKIRNIQADKSGISVPFNSNLIAPGEKATFLINSSVAEDQFENNECLVTYTVTYDIVDKTDKETLYSGLTTEAYQYLSTAPDWESLTYADTDSGFTKTLTPASRAQIDTYVTMSGELWNTFNLFGGGYKYCGMEFPTNVVVKTSKLDSINRITTYVANDSADAKGIDAVMASKEAYGGTNYVAVSCDPTTGDLLNCFFYDYYQLDYETVQTENGTEKRVKYDEDGNTTGKWITNDPKSRADVLALEESDGTITDHRFHVVCEFANIESTFGGAPQIEYAEDGVSYKNIFVPRGSGDSIKERCDYSKTDANDVSLSAGVPGIILSFNKITPSAQSKGIYPFLAWDQETVIQPTDEAIKFTIMCSKPKDFDMHIAVCDDSEAATIRSTYEKAVKFVNDYSAENYTDYDNSSSAIYNYLRQALKDALQAESTAVTYANATTVGSTKAYFARHNETQDFYGDVAMATADASIMNSPEFAALKLSCYENGGVWYQTRYIDSVSHGYVYASPVYMNKELTDDDVSGFGSITIGDGEDAKDYTTAVDAVGNKVVKVKGPKDDVEKWHLLNDVKYEQKWVDIDNPSNESVLFTNPYLEDTDIPATASNGAALYNEISFVYRDSNNVKCNSDDNWTVKIAETDYSIIPGATARGVYAIGSDKLEYAYDLALKNINVKDAAKLYTDISVLRRGLNNVNFNVISYEQMAKLGREAEALFTVDIYNDYSYGDQVIFSCLASEAEAKLEAYNLANETELTLGDLTVTEGDAKNAVVRSNTTTFELNEALRLFNTYLGLVVERGYIGDKLEEEISCAVNGKSCENRDDKSTSYKDVTVNVAEASYTVSGTTYTAESNPDGITYSAESWANFINALDAAVNAAVKSETYPHKDKAYWDYNIDQRDSYDLKVSNVYELRKQLMLAENALEEETAQSAFNVSGKIVVMLNPKNPDNTANANGLADVNIKINGDVVATTNATGDYSFDIANGTYTATLEYAYGPDRTVTINVNGADVTAQPITMVLCDYDKSSTINVTDSTYFNTAFKGRNLVMGDLNRDGVVDVSDSTIFNAFFRTNNLKEIYSPVEIN